MSTRGAQPAGALAWLRGAWWIATKDLKYMLRQRETLLWVFVMPSIFFFFIGSITGGSSSAARRDRLVIVAPTNAGFLLDHLVERLSADFIVERATDIETNADGERTPIAVGPDGETLTIGASRLLIVPGALTDSVVAGVPVQLELVLDAEQLDAGYDRVRVGRGVYSVIADLAVLRVRDGAEPSASGLATLAAEPRLVSVRASAAGERRDIPSGFEQAIPGTLTMFTLVVLLTSGAVLVVIERREGLTRRLASAPLARGTIVLGKLGGRLALGLVQIGSAMLMGTLFFKMHWGEQLPALLIVLVAYAALAAGLGLVLGSIARNEGQAAGIGVLASNILAPLGGCWWPIEVTPPWMQQLALAFPTGWMMDAMHRLVSFNMPAASVLPHFTALTVAALAVAWLAARIYRFES